MPEDTKTPKPVAEPIGSPNGDVVDKQPTPSKESSGSGEDLVAKYERDIAKIKSATQRQINESEKRHREELEALRQQQIQFQRDMIPEEKRPEFDSRLERERLAQLEKENQQLRAMTQEQQVRQQWTAYFQDKFGVDVTHIATSAGDFDDFLSQAHEEVATQLKQARSTLNSAPVGPQTPATLTPPDVEGAPDAPATTGESWDVLIRRYGSQEEVYRMVEQGLLNPRIIPK